LRQFEKIFWQLDRFTYVVAKMDADTTPIYHWRHLLEAGLVFGGMTIAWRYARRLSGSKLLLQVLGGLLLFMLLAVLLEMKVLSVTLSLLMLAMVVIFQQELRHAFVQILGDRLFTPPQNNAELIAQLGEVVGKLSAKHCGALFAWERGMDLHQFMQTGVELDSKFSPALIATIFHPKTTLHDGGVILAQGRIWAAGCLFPISQRELLDRSLGLRHRAALGISEQTDAIAIVVSEETGTISIAHAGNLERGLDAADLRERLTELLTQLEVKPEPVGHSTKLALPERAPTKRLEA
jgi:diadenylate cyclase